MLLLYCLRHLPIERIVLGMNKKVKILIVEDDKFYLDELNDTIHRYTSFIYPSWQFTISTTKNAEDFLEQLEKDVDLVIMEYYLENEFGDVLFPGSYLVRAINLYCKECKVMVLTSSDEEKIESQLKGRGILNLIPKDQFSFLKLTTGIDKIINEKRHSVFT